MPATVRLQDVVEAFEMQSDEAPGFVDLETGEVHTIEAELLRLAEELDEDEEPDIPEWQAPAFETAKLIAFNMSVRFKRLPTKFDVNEWEIMREFADSVESRGVRDDLTRAIHGSGAFRYFKDAIRRHKIENDWYAFRTQSLRQIAIDWCEENQVAWT